jgi:hypothetical protein
MGKAIKTLGIPVGEVWSSPTYRALETVRLASLPNPTTAVELGDNGQSADSGHRDQPFRPIVITCTGDRDHAARLAEEFLTGSSGWSLIVTTDGCPVSSFRGVRQAGRV